MTGPPVQLFVARHGARLDQGDPNWHFTSPTPYDPPLTYGGWGQARSLGNRVAHLILQRSQQQHPDQTPKPVASASTWSPNVNTAVQTRDTISAAAIQQLHKTKIVIHTSPFTRCIQTSIAVAAGMSQVFYNSIEFDKSNALPKPVLRIDAWLGEWLCEDYFTDITPPPASTLMVGTAKSDLMRPSSAGMHIGNSIKTESSHSRSHSVGFIPPTPMYAVGKNEPIPKGYVSHAKDQLDIDYAWDSMKFGDGGEYGEEWGMMHKRVRKGFDKTIEDYSTGDAAKTIPLSKQSPTQWRHAQSFDQIKEVAESESSTNGVSKLSLNDVDSSGVGTDSDTILVFITHGAGCNALLGAMTRQPVLMDIGIASLSMGILSSSPSENPATYSVKLSASSDHLRQLSAASPSIHPASSPSNISDFSPSIRTRKSNRDSSSSFSLYGNKYPTVSSPFAPVRGSMSTVFGNTPSLNDASVRRSASVADTAMRGLWTKPESRLTPTIDAINRMPTPDENAITDEEDTSRPSTASQISPNTLEPPLASQHTRLSSGTWKKPDLSSSDKKEPVRGTGLFQAGSSRNNETSTYPDQVETKIKWTGGLWGSNNVNKSVANNVDHVDGHDRKRRWTVDQGPGRT